MWGGQQNDQGMPVGNRLEGGVRGQGGKRGRAFASLDFWKQILHFLPLEFGQQTPGW